MNSKILQKYTRRTLLKATALLCMSVVAGTQAHSRQVTVPPLDCELTLWMGERIVPGQPILLQYKVKNLSDASIGWQPGDDFDRWFTLILTDEKNQEVAQKPPRASKKPPALQSGLRALADPLLAPADSRTGYLLVTRYYPNLKPGIYHLSVKVKTPYVVGTTADERRPLDELKTIIRQSGSVYTRDFAFTVNVGEPNKSRLVRASEDLRNAILSDSNDADRVQNLPVLGAAVSTLPEAHALAVWRQLANDVRISRDFVASNLVKVGTIRAASLIEAMEWDTEGQPERKDPYSALPHLLNMYYEGEIELQKHIVKICERHNIKIGNGNRR